MAKKAAKRGVAKPQPSKEQIAAQHLRDQLRRLKALNVAIRTEARAVERAIDAANTRMVTLLGAYAERTGSVLVDEAAWNRVSDRKTELEQLVDDQGGVISGLRDRIVELEAPATASTR